MWQHWINLLAGIWLIISPYVGFSTAAMTTNLVITGVIVGGLSLWGAMETGAKFGRITR
ncbi:MAG: SPW repeat protein [Candidatus Doudnabacteria bacterium]|nr:SPW repeat protein [Candidatus Doudnabacteria bacterium]